MHREDGNGNAPEAPESAPRKGFLTRLARDVRGNTLAIVGAALVPLSAMIGSGVDMSRAYMAKTRLQSACDAAALAGRRIMTNDTMTDTVRAEAIRFFNFNFRQGLYDTNNFTPGVTRPTNGTVRVTASTRIPTTIMHMFGFDTLPLNVTCEASLNFVNTDVMLVLDVTGSMDDNLNGTKKIVSLRDAVMALYDELAPIQTQLQNNGLRLRYGIVPYSSTVNVGTLLRSVSVNNLGDSVAYQSRVANYTTPVYVANAPTANGPYWEYYRGSSNPQTGTVASQATTAISSANCVKFNQNTAFSGFTATTPLTTGTAPSPQIVTTFPYDNSMTSGGSGGEFGWTGAPVTSGTNRSCRRLRTETTTTYVTRYSFTNWTYRQSTFDTSAYRNGSATIATNTGGSVAVSGAYNVQQLPIATAGSTGLTTTTSNWNGCIEEPDTVNTITASSNYTIPAGANDLNINLVPSSAATRWRPMWPDIAYYRTAGSTTASSGTSVSTAACPAAAVRLTAWTRAAMLTYVNALSPVGSTYHDHGMRWGARLLSNSGVFADSPNEFNAMPVSRHIIFMTDGQMDTDSAVYGSYGMERNDMRISGMSSPSESELNGRHNQRFKMICNAARGMNISIWVIAFGTSLSSDMLACASNANQASTVADRNALIARFREIGNNIGALRLTQ